MSASKAKTHAINAKNERDTKKAIDELALAIIELAASIRKLESKSAPE